MYGGNQRSGQPGQQQQFYGNQGFPQRQGQQAQSSPFYYQGGPQYQAQAAVFPAGAQFQAQRQGQQPQLSPFYYQDGLQYQGQTAMFPAGAQFQAQYINRMGTPGDKQPSRAHSNEQLTAGTIGRPHSTTSSTHAPSPIIRGPPRKPKQSGHALWVGNLPPGANVVDLKDHFSRDATNDILSVFLISKSNCAFVNYKTEDACAKAVERFNESRFQGVRLLCRLRRTSVLVDGKDGQAKGVPTGPAALAQNQTQAPNQRRHEAEDVAQITEGLDNLTTTEERGHAKEKFFVVKSLTVEDLETSVRTGQWATQAHNEEALNKAYKEADSVYLVFSANKSGEYFGYARMTSPINHDPSKAIEFAPSVTAAAAAAVDDADLPKAIPTPATETAPKGRIIDDSARGTIFWEAEGAEEDKAKENDDQGQSSNPTVGVEQPGRDQKAWGKPFSLEWLSTNKVPFYRTRGLRNAWNSNREVKIARDGTELETGVGRRLIAMFAREHSPAGGPGGPTMMAGPMMSDGVFNPPGIPVGGGPGGAPMMTGPMMGTGVFGPPGMGMPRYYNS